MDSKTKYSDYLKDRIECGEKMGELLKGFCNKYDVGIHELEVWFEPTFGEPEISEVRIITK